MTTPTPHSRAIEAAAFIIAANRDADDVSSGEIARAAVVAFLRECAASREMQRAWDEDGPGLNNAEETWATMRDALIRELEAK